jgi:cephalosporin hydroxylase
MNRGSITVDFDRAVVVVKDPGGSSTHPLGSDGAFAAVSRAWLRCGWDTKHVYTFTWLGRPIIQLPEDIVRLQETLWMVRPDVVVETGVAHGGSLVLSASVCHAMGRGRVIGVDVDVRPHNRTAIEQHELAHLITLVEGSSTDPEIIARVKSMVAEDERVMLLLDANHSAAHVSAELEAYAGLVSPGSFAIVADGIMEDLVGAPRAAPEWATDNPRRAIRDFLARHPEFEAARPARPFDESAGLRFEPTYWADGWLRRRS